MSKPLADLVVLECSGGVATRYCGKLFAEHGARVVQAYEPDDRHLGYGGDASLAYSAWLDDGKERAGFRLEKPADIARAIEPDLIIAGQYPADIALAKSVASSFKRTPLLLALTWFGESGPYAGWRGSDAVIQAMTGVAYAFGPQAGAPVLPQGHAPQVVAGATAFIAVMACLLSRAEGRSEHRVDVNVFEAHMCLSEHSGPGFAATGIRSARRGVNRFFPVYPQTIFPSADGWIGVTALTPQQWQGFCELIGLPELARDPAYSTTDLRMASARQLDEILGPALRKHSSRYLLEEGQRRRVPMAPVPTMAEVLSTPHWRERASFRGFEFSSSKSEVRGFEGPSMSFRLHSPGENLLAQQGSASAKAADPNSVNPNSANRLPSGQGPLAGIRVLDLSMGWSGPLCGRHFADLGAEVIKVEGCAHMDWWRGWNALEAGDPPPYETKSNFNAVNRNKRGIALDLRGPRGLELLRSLAARADLLIENYAPGVLDRLGLSAESLAKINPRLSYVSMGAFGSAGPWSEFRAYGSTTEQASGMCFLQGQADWPPAMQHTAYGDPIAGIYAATAALIALYGRRRSKLGTTIDLSQVECLFQLCADGLVAQSATKTAPARTGSQRPTSVWSGCVQCRGNDQWIVIDIEDDQDLAQSLLKAGVVGSASAASFGAWAENRDCAAACELLQNCGFTAGPVSPATSLLEDAHLKAVGFWIQAERCHVGLHILPKAPYAIDGRSSPLNWPAPTLGEHNGAVLSRVLGLSVSAVAELEAAGIIGTRAAA